jgi:CRISPR/Cas system-associated exonuclease Cas4 (RecB family)
MLSEKRGKPVRETIVHYLDSDEKRTIVMNPFMKEEIEMLVSEIRELLGNALLPDQCGSMQKCNACGLRKECFDKTLMHNLMQSLLISAQGPRERQLLLG